MPEQPKYEWKEVSSSFTVTDWGDWTPEMIALLEREVVRFGGRVVPLNDQADSVSSASPTGIP